MIVLVFVGLLEPYFDFVAWLNTVCFLRDMNSGPDHSVIESKTRGRIIILEAAQHPQTAITHQTSERFATDEGKLWYEYSVCVSFCGIT